MPPAGTAPSLTARERGVVGHGLVRRVVRVTVMLSLWIPVGFGVGLGACLTVPNLFDYRALTVLSGSMEPALGVGSVVIDQKISPLEARPGDIVSFPDPAQRSRSLTHRLRSARVEGDAVFMVTKGDANDTVERWSVPADGKIGRVDYHVPKVGYVRAFISTRGARLAVLGIVLALGLYLLIDLWRPRPGGRP